MYTWPSSTPAALLAMAKELRGYTRIAFIERKSSIGFLFVSFNSLDEFKDALRQFTPGFKPIGVCVERPDGGVEWFDLDFKPTQGEPREITERMGKFKT